MHSFFIKSLNGLNKVLSAFKTKKASKINGLRGVFWQGLKVLTILEDIYICNNRFKDIYSKNYYSLYDIIYFIKTLRPYIFIYLKPA